MGIGRYLTHTVDIVHVTMTRGVRSTTTTSDVPARISESAVTTRDESGDLVHFTKTMVFLAGDTEIDEGDSIIIDEKERPVVNIARCRRRPSVIHHLEVEVS
jgi:hypothetical protein